MSEGKLCDKKVRVPYPRDGDVDVIAFDAKYQQDPEDTRKFLLKTMERTISIFESQLDALVMIIKAAPKGKAVRVYWAQQPNSKTIMPELPTE